MFLALSKGPRVSQPWAGDLTYFFHAQFVRFRCSTEAHRRHFHPRPSRGSAAGLLGSPPSQAVPT